MNCVVINSMDLKTRVWGIINYINLYLLLYV